MALPVHELVVIHSIIRTELAKVFGFAAQLIEVVHRCYRIQWSDMAYLTESIVVDRMYVSPKDE